MPKFVKILLVVAALCCPWPALALAQTPDTSSTPPAVTPVAITTPTPEQVAAQQRAERDKLLAQARKARHLRQQVMHYRSRAWHWRFVMQKSYKHRPFFAHASRNVPRLKYLVRVWKKRAHQARWQAHHPPHLWLWLCIHRQEGSWTDNASNNPHWGGLQMGIWFMSTYARKLLIRFGKANNWPPLMQIWVAEHAYKREHYSRAWLLGQWVPTASRCI